MKENIVNNKHKRMSQPVHRPTNNPGVDRTTWERLNHKWSELDKNGHKLMVEFRLIADPNDEKNILAIDVIQSVDGEFITETVQRNVGEAYPIVGIARLSKEQLENLYKEMIQGLHQQLQLKKDVDLVVSMSPRSQLSGEMRGYIAARDSGEKSSILVNYQHYYLLNALREKMIESTGDGWHTVRAVYRSGELEFYFDY